MISGAVSTWWKNSRLLYNQFFILSFFLVGSSKESAFASCGFVIRLITMLQAFFHLFNHSARRIFVGSITVKEHRTAVFFIFLFSQIVSTVKCATVKCATVKCGKFNALAALFSKTLFTLFLTKWYTLVLSFFLTVYMITWYPIGSHLSGQYLVWVMGEQ